MPVFSFPQRSASQAITLTESGALVTVEISIPAQLKAYLAEEGLPIPEPRVGFALIDTGASASAVDAKVFYVLGIAPIDRITTSTPHGEAESEVYAASVAFPGLDLAEMPMETLIGCDLNWDHAEGKEIIMLLGRNILQDFLFVYNGRSGDIALAY
jgi:predicted aspartyl protease